ncbi:MAG: polyphosphate polymerase domain-containing protein [Firmicutes bacterium]|nr:polyphosphate polymerase domain-containing protein [Bacillota bacterium]
MHEITKRHELKYLISKTDYEVFKKKLDPLLQKDLYSGNKPYTITSLYFDDIFNTAYKQKINGDSYRYKYRIRYYDLDTSLFKLEKKEKRDQITNKESATLSLNEVQSILKNDIAFLQEKQGELYQEFYQKIKNGLLKPKVIVEYERVAYTHIVGNCRITFDQRLRSSFNIHDLFNQSTMYIDPLLTNEVIMEIKFNGEFPFYIKSLLQSYNSIQTSVSKYVYSRKYNYNL